MDLVELLSTLKSRWVLLSSASVFFPGAMYLLNLGSIKTSQLGSLYPATAVPLSALALLIVLLLLSEEAPSRNSQITRALALVTTILLSIVGLIGFIYYSTSKNDLFVEKDSFTMCYGHVIDFQGNNRRFGDGYKREIHHYAGRLIEVRKPCEFRDAATGSLILDVGSRHQIAWTDDETKNDIGMDPIEYYALIFFDLCFIALTASFTMISLRLKEKDLY
jgi:hypothetical protein